MGKRSVFIGSVLPVGTALCAFSSGLPSLGRPPQQRPFHLTAQPIVERPLMRSPLARRGLRDYFEARCVLANTSDQVQGFHTSAMAGWVDWKTSDPRIFIPPVPVISMGIGSVALRPGEQYAEMVPLSTRHVRAGQTIKFRVGFRLRKWTPGQPLRQEHRQRRESSLEQTVWSGVVSVKVRPEWAVRSAVVAAENGEINQ